MEGLRKILCSEKGWFCGFIVLIFLGCALYDGLAQAGPGLPMRDSYMQAIIAVLLVFVGGNVGMGMAAVIKGAEQKAGGVPPTTPPVKPEVP